MQVAAERGRVREGQEAARKPSSASSCSSRRRWRPSASPRPCATRRSSVAQNAAESEKGQKTGRGRPARLRAERRRPTPSSGENTCTRQHRRSRTPSSPCRQAEARSAAEVAQFDARGRDPEGPGASRAAAPDRGEVVRQEIEKRRSRSPRKPRPRRRGAKRRARPTPRCCKLRRRGRGHPQGAREPRRRATGAGRELRRRCARGGDAAA